jgi:heme-degrading monooxygenase HmoA
MAHARVALYRVEPGAMGEVQQKVQEGMVPILRQQAGFISYDVIDGGGDTAISVSRWETHEQAEQAVQVIADWVGESGVEELVERTQNYVGEVIVSA